MAIYLTTLNLTDSSVVFFVDGVLYEYFCSAEALRRINHVARKSGARALNLAKRLAEHWQKVGD